MSAGSQSGSQRRHAPSHAGRHAQTISTASWHFRRQQATSSDGSNAPEKRKVGSSTLPLTTHSHQRICCLVNPQSGRSSRQCGARRACPPSCRSILTCADAHGRHLDDPESGPEPRLPRQRAACSPTCSRMVMTGPSQASDLVEPRSLCAQRHGRTLKTISLSDLRPPSQHHEKSRLDGAGSADCLTFKAPLNRVPRNGSRIPRRTRKSLARSQVL